MGAADRRAARGVGATDRGGRVARLQLNPSTLARFYFLECERYLRYTAATDRAAEGIPAGTPDRSPVTRALVDAGRAWEAHVLETYLRDAVTGPPARSGQPTDRVLSADRTLELLASAAHAGAPAVHTGGPAAHAGGPAAHAGGPAAHTGGPAAHTGGPAAHADGSTGGRLVLFQPTFRPPATLAAAYGLDPGLVTFGECRPDLVWVADFGQGPELRVVDLKASDVMRLGHRVQVAAYHLIIRHTLAAEGIALDCSRAGGVWLFEHDHPHWFPITDILPALEAFLSWELPRLAAGPPEAAALAPVLPLRVVRVLRPLPPRGRSHRRRVVGPLPLPLRQAPPHRAWGPHGR